MLAFLLSGLPFLSACTADPESTQDPNSQSIHSALVIKVKDGDSLILRYAQGIEKEVRLFGIDAPEYNQAFGQDAKHILENLTLKKTVLVQKHTTDRYQREVVLLIRVQDDLNINLAMLEQGAAWVYRQYQNEPSWARLEKRAKSQQQGLWAGARPVAPWEWRKSQ